LSDVIVCLGKQAVKPYYIESARIHIYGIEELCYFLSEYYCLLTREVLSEKLALWIDEQCELKELSRSLLTLIHQSGSLHATAGMILEYVAFGSEDEIKQVEKSIRDIELLSEFEQRKLRAAYFVEQGKHMLAMEQYAKQLSLLEHKDIEKHSELFHNMGTVCARLFYFDLASEFFEKAYACEHKELDLKHFLVAKRMSMTQKEYHEFTEDVPEYSKLAIRMEDEIEKVSKQWKGTTEKKMLDDIHKKKESYDRVEYYASINVLVQNWKTEYESFGLL